MQSQSQKFFLKTLLIDNNGNVINKKTNKALKISKRGFFTYNGKNYNLAKVMMYVFNKIPFENSNHIEFKDNNPKNYNLNNLSYLHKEPKQPQPNYDTLSIILNQFYGYQMPNLIKDAFLYRTSLNAVEMEKNILISWKDDLAKAIVKDYINYPYKSIHLLSIEYSRTVLDTRHIIYKYLSEIIKVYAGEMERLKSELHQKPKTLKEFNKIQAQKVGLVLNRPK